jgi:hypothetical protein
MENRTTGENVDYTRKQGIIENGIETPDHAPEWAKDRAKLWNAVEEKENRKNSQFAREFNIALPSELTPEQNKKMVQDFCKEQFTNRGIVADWAIHEPNRQGDERNIHAHIMTTTRKIDRDGWTEKDREGNTRDRLKEIRQAWEKTVNKELERNGIEKRIDCRTLEAQGIEREPQQHQGYKATAIERRGEQPDRTRTAPEVKQPAQEKEQQKPEAVAKLQKDIDRIDSLIFSMENPEALKYNLGVAQQNEQTIDKIIGREAYNVALGKVCENQRSVIDKKMKEAEALYKRQPAEPEKRTIFNGQKVEQQTADRQQWEKEFASVSEYIKKAEKAYSIMTAPPGERDIEAINKMMEKSPLFMKEYEKAYSEISRTDNRYSGEREFSQEIKEIAQIVQEVQREKERGQEQGQSRERDRGRSF